ncbi:hypothetical protein VPH35_093513 [Triticum aestivum]|uniref:Uncharacterized protein n=1 Tax=Triticum turgidum subsp. durum TaxID=4567 RepID=A0A9R1ASR4_TRITD|nr:unnamed protein product [Triticum turgidum subsp. durum]
MEKCTKRLQPLALLLLVCFATHAQCSGTESGDAEAFACYKLDVFPSCNPKTSRCYCCTMDQCKTRYGTMDECQAHCVASPLGVNESAAPFSSYVLP